MAGIFDYIQYSIFPFEYFKDKGKEYFKMAERGAKQASNEGGAKQASRAGGANPTNETRGVGIRKRSTSQSKSTTTAASRGQRTYTSPAPQTSQTREDLVEQNKRRALEILGPPSTQQQPQISQKDWNTYINQPIVDNNTNTTNYDTNYIRGFRGQGEQGYRDVNSYLTWLRNNKDSADYKLFMQNGYFNDSGKDLNYDQIGAMLASQGIRGNLGRRDSRRLGNVLTRLRDQSTAGTDANKEFLQGVVSSYNQNKDKWVRPAEGYTGLRNATITGDGQIGFLDESGNETYFPYSKQSPTYQINGSSPEFQAIRNQFFTTNPSSGFQPVSQGNWLGSAGNILGSTYRPQWNMTSGPRPAFFGTSISNQAKNMMKTWNDFTNSLLPRREFNSGANS